MAYLLDTGVLFRLANEEDTQHDLATRAVELLSLQRQKLFTTNQNIAEFWNVAIRAKGDNSLGRSVDVVTKSIRSIVQPICTVLREHSNHFAELKRLLEANRVIGKQVHDTRLIASMLTWKIERILTLNEKHFKRFEAEGITIHTPQSLVGASDNS